MKRVNSLLALCALTFFCATTAAPVAADNPHKGKWNFKKKCVFCHQVNSRATSEIGPELRGLLGRTVGTLKGVEFSPHLRLLGEKGIKWDEKLLGAYIVSLKARADDWFVPYRQQFMGSKCLLANAAIKSPVCAPYNSHSKRRPVRAQDAKNIVSYLKRIRKPRAPK